MAQPDAVRNEFQEEEEEEVCDVEAGVRSIMQRRRDGEFPEVRPLLLRQVDASKRGSSEYKLANDMPPFDPKRRKPKRRKPTPVPCPCLCNVPNGRIQLVAGDDPLAGEFLFRCVCQSCGDELGFKTRLHPVYVMFVGGTCEDSLGHRG